MVRVGFEEQKMRENPLPWKLIFKVMIAVFFFIYLFKTEKIDFNCLSCFLSRPSALLIPALMFLIAALISIERWRLLMTVVHVRINYISVMRYSFIGIFFSNFFAGSIGGDLVKGYYAVRERKDKLGIAMSVILDRIIGLYAVVFIPTVVSFIWTITIFRGDYQNMRDADKILNLSFYTISVFSLICLMTAVILSDSEIVRRTVQYLTDRLPFSEELRKAHVALLFFKRSPAAIIKAFLISLLSQFFLYAGIFFIASSIGVEGLTFLTHLYIIPLGLMINAIPVAPAGLGVGETGFYMLYFLFGSTKGAEIAVIFHMISLVMMSCIGMACYFSIRRKEVNRC